MNRRFLLLRFEVLLTQMGHAVVICGWNSIYSTVYTVASACAFLVENVSEHRQQSSCIDGQKLLCAPTSSKMNAFPQLIVRHDRTNVYQAEGQFTRVGSLKFRFRGVLCPKFQGTNTNTVHTSITGTVLLYCTTSVVAINLCVFRLQESLPEELVTDFYSKSRNARRS